MAFERARIINHASVGTGLKVSLSKPRTAQAKMKFSITPAIAKSFGWSDGDKLEVLIGTAEHHGIIRMRKNNSVGEAVVAFRKGPHQTSFVTVALGHQSNFVDRSEPSRWCQFEQIDEGYVEIILPRWADETRPNRPVVAAPTVNAPKPVAQPQQRQNVTSTLMGDPPPNRRAMLDKVGGIKA